MTQNEQVRLQPSAIFTYALPPGVESGARARRLDHPVGRVADEHALGLAAEHLAELEHVARAEEVVDLGHLAASSSGWRWERQPATTRRRQRPLSFSSAISKMVSIDSFFASPMKPHVLTTMTSASERVGDVGEAPPRARRRA